VLYVVSEKLKDMTPGSQSSMEELKMKEKDQPERETGISLTLASCNALIILYISQFVKFFTYDKL